MRMIYIPQTAAFRSGKGHNNAPPSNNRATCAMSPLPPARIATHHPKFRPDCPHFQFRRDSFETLHFPAGDGVELYLEQVCDIYYQTEARELIRFLTVVFLDMAHTQTMASDLIHIERSSLSVAKNYGEIGARPLANILSHPQVVKELLDQLPLLRRQLGRAAFIADAEFTASRIRSTQTKLDVIAYEILCRHIEYCSNPLGGNLRDAIPGWYNKIEITHAETLVEQLGDSGFASDYLLALEREWLDIFVYVWAAAEGLGAVDLWKVG
ncbi:MAG TPA: hypothetical protein VGG19_14190 [Tepidisphaeraceae bacterium]|jgi:hypothetical protein